MKHINFTFYLDLNKPKEVIEIKIFLSNLFRKTGSHRKGRNVFLPSHSHTPIETKMRQDKKVER